MHYFVLKSAIIASKRIKWPNIIFLIQLPSICLQILQELALNCPITKLEGNPPTMSYICTPNIHVCLFDVNDICNQMITTNQFLKNITIQNWLKNYQCQLNFGEKLLSNKKRKKNKLKYLLKFKFNY